MRHPSPAARRPVAVFLAFVAISSLVVALGCAGGGVPRSDGYGEGYSTGPRGAYVPLGGPGRLGYLGFTDDGGFVAAETPLQEGNQTFVHL